MKCVVVDMRNRLFGDAISGSLQHFDSGFRVYQTEGTAAEDLCVDTHADVLVAEVTAYPPWRLEQRLDLCRRLRQGLPGCQVALVVDEVCEPQLAPGAAGEKGRSDRRVLLQLCLLRLSLCYDRCPVNPLKQTA